MSNELIAKMIAEKISVALEGSFSDALAYGRGYIRITLDLQRDIKVEHVPFLEMDKEAEAVTQIKKYLA